MSPLDFASFATSLFTVVAGIASIFLVAGTFALLYLTGKLYGATEELEKATDDLRRIQIRPKVILAGPLHYDRAANGGAVVDVVNRGTGSALGVKLMALLNGEKSFPVGRITGDESIPVSGTSSFEIIGVPHGLPLELTPTYSDIEGTHFEERLPGPLVS